MISAAKKKKNYVPVWTSCGPTSVKRHVIHGFFRRMQGYSLDVE
jgi:hypothetical protein